MKPSKKSLIQAQKIVDDLNSLYDRLLIDGSGGAAHGVDLAIGLITERYLAPSGEVFTVEETGRPLVSIAEAVSYEDGERG